MKIATSGVAKAKEMQELKAKIEAILYCTPQGIDLEKLARALGLGSRGHVKEVLKSMQEELEQRKSGLSLVEQDGLWKFKIREEYIELVKEAAKPELEKSVLETLAYIAHKKEVSQAAVIKIRSNKAYNHIKELEEKGFIEAKKSKKTKTLSPSKKFYDYFQIKEEPLQLPESQATQLPQKAENSQPSKKTETSQSTPKEENSQPTQKTENVKEEEKQETPRIIEVGKG